MALLPADWVAARPQWHCQPEHLSEALPLRSVQQHLDATGRNDNLRMLQGPLPLNITEPRWRGVPFDCQSSLGLTWTEISYLATLEEATVRTASDLILSAQGSVLSDARTHPLAVLSLPWRENWMVVESSERVVLRRSDKRMKIAGPAYSLLSAASHQYGHWLMDLLPRLRHARVHPEFDQASLLVDADLPTSQVEALAFVLGGQANLVRVPADTEVQVERLICVGPDVFFPYQCRDGVSNSVHMAPTHPAALQFMHARAHAALDSRPVGAPTRRLFVRRNASVRRLENQEALIEGLTRRWGFEVIQPEAMSFVAQMQAFSEAQLVVGPMGSGMSNAFACARGAAVITLSTQHAGNWPAWAQALEGLGIRHEFVVGQGIAGSHGIRHHWNYTIDEPALQAAVEEALAWQDQAEASLP